MTDNRLVIGLDYGTTYTGVSFCEVSDSHPGRQHIEIIHDWPSKHTKIGTKEKVPSEVAYLNEGICWGSNIPSHQPREIWTKLELDNQRGGEAAKIVAELSTSPSVPRKEPVEIVADFLGQVKSHLIKNLDNKFGPDLWRSLSIILVVTVPARLQAIDKAGFNSSQFPQLTTPIMVTTEPEAAAIYTMLTLRGTARNEQLAVGDGFIVCDMGGGTVDLISYRVKSLNPTIIEEATVGNGAQCGGSFVDRAFLRWLEGRLGTTDFVKIAGCRSEQIPRIFLTKKASKILQDFSLEIKTGFSGTEIGYLVLPTPLSAIEEDESRGIRDGEIIVTAEDTRLMFQTPICRTYELLNEQLQRARINGVDVKYVFLVGGFSESPYMHQKIKDYMDKRNIKTIKPTYAWSAVARGAAAKGMEGKQSAVLARKCRRHYGTACSSTFNRKIHKSRDRYIDEYDGRTMARNQMIWLVKKGEDLETSKASHAYTTLTAHFWPKESRRTTWELYACDADTAAQGSTAESVYRVATLIVDFDDVPASCYEHKVNDRDKKYLRLRAEVHISIQSSLEFFVTVDGKKYGSLTAEYD
ncbi:hypothetical protein DE146DRAFT_763611 [Phaeosphaeria sp. MPI-PUGE-AT-0046c]|nr:hypothetical protein DE146DRAFT_763611 [Phaeosphaeria sp. MPI-PUGE-AT-0046c]